MDLPHHRKVRSYCTATVDTPTSGEGHECRFIQYSPQPEPSRHPPFWPEFERLGPEILTANVLSIHRNTNNRASGNEPRANHSASPRNHPRICQEWRAKTKGFLDNRPEVVQLEQHMQLVMFNSPWKICIKFRCELSVDFSVGQDVI
jgi:hypothetical protein